MSRYFSLQPMRRHLTSSCYSMKLSAIMRCVYWVGVPTAGSFSRYSHHNKKQRNQTIEFSWGLYCLVVLFLLVYVITFVPRYLQKEPLNRVWLYYRSSKSKHESSPPVTPYSVCSSHIFKMSDFKDQLFTCAGLPSDNIVEFSCGKKLFWKLILIFSC